MKKKYISYDKLELYNENINNVIDAKNSNSIALLKKYTDDKIEENLSIDVSNIYTKSEVDTALSNKSDVGHNHDDKYDSLGSANVALDSAKEYINSEITNLIGMSGSTNTTSKIFLIGATSQVENSQTYSNDSVYVEDGCLYNCGVRVRNEIFSSTEPTNQNEGDYWTFDY